MTATEYHSPPTNGERYASAIGTSDLRLRETRGDVDYIIAAGMIPDRLASCMYRLIREYDAIRAQHHAVEARLCAAEALAEVVQGGKAEDRASRAKTIRDTARRQATQEHLLILLELKSLRDTKQLFGDFALKRAAREGLMRSDRQIAGIAGKVLDFFLDPTCRTCEGRGFNGGSHRGDPKIGCRGCGGARERSADTMGHDDDERRFAGHLLMAINAKLHRTDGDLRANLNAVEAAKDVIAEMHAEAYGVCR